MGLLLPLYVASCCWSLVNMADDHRYIGIACFDKAQLGAALLYVLSCAALGFFFAVKRFSFDYFVGFHYTRWCCAISGSSNFLESNNWLAAISAFASILAFLVPALFITSPNPAALHHFGTRAGSAPVRHPHPGGGHRRDRGAL
jgi:hypothetical protein